ncbi:hypothetical protein F4803DRAFT_535035 [Xylaria telfairii]|nr:hypothetical protein F4803DRAFT_535035 [Xylaria telfairii]
MGTKDSPPAEAASNPSGTEAAESAREIRLDPPLDPPQPTKNPPYLDLHDPFYLGGSSWTNDPEQLDLDIWFDPQKPNLGDQFGISELRPVIKQPKYEQYLLVDMKNQFYTWNPNEGPLYRVKEQPLEPKDAARMMTNGFTNEDLVQMYNLKSYSRG